MNFRQLIVLLYLAAILVAGITLTSRQLLSAAFPDDADFPPTASSLFKFLDRIEITSETAPGKFLAALIKDSPEKFAWTGQQNGHLFAAAVRSLPKGSVRKQAEPAFMKFIQVKMVSEILKMKSIVDTYAKHGLTETEALVQAVERAAEQLNVTGSLKGFLSKVGIEEDCAVGYLVVNELNVIARLQEESEMNKVRATYKAVLHVRMRKRMKQEKWAAALKTWDHLEGLKLVSQEIVLDAVLSAFNVGANERVLDMIAAFVEAYQDHAKPQVLEEMGDVAIKIETDRAQETAVLVYDSAFRLRMSYTTKRYIPLIELP